MSHCEWKPIEGAPRDGTDILVWSRWDWDGMDGDDCDDRFYAQVAAWRWDSFIAKSGNPYCDYAFGATHWMPIPPPPEE